MKSGLAPTELRSCAKLTTLGRFRAHGERSAINCRCSTNPSFVMLGYDLRAGQAVVLSSGEHSMTKARKAAKTVAFVDDYCAHYRSVFANVRHFEQFTQLELGLLAETKRKSLPRLASSAAIIDSQSVKTLMGGLRGYDGNKKLVGRKRFILVDTEGFLLSVVVHAASIPDRQGGQRVLQAAGVSFPRLQHI